MAKKSAGIIAFRKLEHDYEVFLVHPGGPFWAKKDEHAWSIPKGETNEGEDILKAAIREFNEETGFHIDGDFVRLNETKQSGGKIIFAWAVKANFDPTLIKSNTFKIEWPPKSGKMSEFPEVDKAAWFSIPEAKQKIVKGQIPLIEQLEDILVTKL